MPKKPNISKITPKKNPVILTGVCFDTNVLIIANNRGCCGDSTNPPNLMLSLKCSDALMKFADGSDILGQIVLIDSENQILQEYARYASYSGNPGAGDVFFKWIVENSYNSPSILQFSSRSDELMSKFESHECFRKLDRADKKFIKIALQFLKMSSHSQSESHITFAADFEDWKIAKVVFGCEVRLKFLKLG